MSAKINGDADNILQILLWLVKRVQTTVLYIYIYISNNQLF